MSGSEIPEPVRTFILRYIHSVDQLETLLSLWRAAPAAFSAQVVGEVRRTSTKLAEQRLRDLAGVGLVRQVDGRDGSPEYCYLDGPHGPALAEVADCYATRPASVIELICSRPSE
jgi:hypothetical protein